jgi:hypothetical protein
MAQTFKPTAEQIQAAQTLYFAKAFLGIVRPVFHNLETAILANGTYHYNDDYFTEKWKGRDLGLPADRIIRDRNHLHMIAGLNEACEDANHPGDAARYYRELRARALMLGFVHGENADCRADNEVHDAERALINACTSFTGITADQVSGSLENWATIVELTMKLFASFVKGGITPELAAYQDARMITSRYYYEGDDGKRVDLLTLPPNTYALAGVHSSTMKGKLCVRVQSGLTPLFDGITNRQAERPDNAGMTYNGNEWYAQ